MTEMDYIDMFENFAIKAALYRFGVEAANKERQEPAKKTDENIMCLIEDIILLPNFFIYTKLSHSLLSRPRKTFNINAVNGSEDYQRMC